MSNGSLRYAGGMIVRAQWSEYPVPMQKYHLLAPDRSSPLPHSLHIIPSKPAPHKPSALPLQEVVGLVPRLGAGSAVIHLVGT